MNFNFFMNFSTVFTNITMLCAVKRLYLSYVILMNNMLTIFFLVYCVYSSVKDGGRWVPRF